MVWGHTDGPFVGFIYLFHMAIFFIASGFCWNEKNSADFASLKKYLLRKVKTLYLPYVLCNSIYTLLNPVFVKLMLYSADSLMDGKTILIQIGKAVLFGGGVGFAGATWFLRTLFFVSAGHAVLIFLTKKILPGKYIRAGVLVLCIAAAQLISSFNITLPKGLQSCFAAYLAYFFGICFRKYFADLSRKISKLQSAAAFLVSSAVLAGLSFVGEISVGSGSIENVVFYAAASVAGWIMLWGAASLLPQVARPIFAVAGKYSIYVVVLHFLVFKIVSVIYVFAAHADLSLLSSFPSISGVPWLWVGYVIVGTVVPVLIGVLIDKIKNCFKNRTIRQSV